MTKSIDDILSDDDDFDEVVVVARIPRVRRSLRDEHVHLCELLPTLKSDTIDEHPDLRSTVARLAEIEAEIAESAFEVKMRGIGHRAWADLMAKHPPTRQQQAAHQQAFATLLDHNPQTFPQAAIAAASFEPKMSEEQVEALISKPWFNETCWTELWSKCLEANVNEAAPKSPLAAGLIRLLKGVSAERATNSESPAQSSSDE